MSHKNSVKMASLSMSFRSSVDRAPARCSGGHGFDSCRGLRFFFLDVFFFTLVSLLIISSFTCFLCFLEEDCIFESDFFFRFFLFHARVIVDYFIFHMLLVFLGGGLHL